MSTYLARSRIIALSIPSDGKDTKLMYNVLSKKTSAVRLMPVSIDEAFPEHVSLALTFPCRLSNNKAFTDSCLHSPDIPLDLQYSLSGLLAAHKRPDLTKSCYCFCFLFM